MSDEGSFAPLVVIGSSAGGVEALSTLVSTLPADFPAPIVIAQHLVPHTTSHLDHILRRRGPLAVRTVQHTEHLERGVIFVVPANRHVSITDSEVALPADGAGRPKPSVDRLFRSAAQAYGEGLIAVVLTGTGSDGATGARYVKQTGGMVIIQDPDTASYPAMPLSLDPTTVDVIADLERIGPLLHEVLTGKYTPAPPGEPRALRSFLEQLRLSSGIDFNSYKTPTIMRRLQRRMAATHSEQLPDYVRYVQQHPEEYQRLISSFLIKVTEFYCDSDLFAYLRQHVLPELIEEARRRGNGLRLWSAGCATGEEAYSLAMLLAETLGEDLERFSVRIFATDLDNDAVAFARRGIYPPSALVNLSREQVARFFSEVDGAYEIRKHIRALTVFGQHDLGQRAPFPRIDLALCRNVLIYFTSELQRRALQLFAFSLRDRGVLVLGKAETTTSLAENFEVEQPQLRIYRRAGERVLIPPARIRDSMLAPLSRLFPGAHLPPAKSRGRTRNLRDSPRPLVPGDRLEHYLHRLPIGVAVVDRQYDIHLINGVARRLLGIHSSVIGEDLVHLTQYVPPAVLRTSLDVALRGESQSSVLEVLPGDLPLGEPRWLEISTHPEKIDGEGGTREAALLLVREVSGTIAERRRLEESLAQQQEEAQRLAAQMERLASTNRQLLEANQELNASVAELRNANEEFRVGREEAETLNEELQATNEELETLNEELQATVEELNTTNDDLQARSTELQDLAASLGTQRTQSEQARAWLEAILANMSDAVLVVDGSGTPVLTNTAYDQTFGALDLMLEDEQGAPLLPESTLEALAARGEPFRLELTVRAPDGNRRWFEAFGQPFRIDGQEQGCVVVLREITDRSLRRLQEQFVAIASHELRTPLTGLSGYLQVLVRDLPPDPATRAHRYATRALEQARRLDVLVRDLLDMARLQAGRLRFTFEWLELAPLVARSVETAQVITQSQTVALDTSGAGDIPLAVRGDAGRLEQALLNLLTNAIQHAPSSPRIDVRLRRAGDLAEIQVQDYGPGIPAADIPHLFSSFHQVQRREGPRSTGLGLGLYIAGEIVTAHGGTITVESVEAQGTTFTVHLPLLTGAPASA